MFSIFTKPRLIDRPVSPRVMQKHKPHPKDEIHELLSKIPPQDPLPTPTQAGYVPKRYHKPRMRWPLPKITIWSTIFGR